MGAPSHALSLARKHLVDVTMFWSAASGGVRSYLLAKRAWMARNPGWRHTIVTPMADEPDMAVVPSVPLPRSGGYRLPLRRGVAAEVIAGQNPDLIEAGDPYVLAWAAQDAARRLEVPAVAFCHSNLQTVADGLLPRAIAPLLKPLSGSALRAYLRHVYAGFDLVLAPSEAMCQRLLDLGLTHVERQPLGVDCHTFHPCRRDLAWRRSLGLPAYTRLLVYAGRFAPEKNLQLLADAVRRLGPGYALLLLGSGPARPAGPQVIVRPFERSRAELARVLASADAFVHAGDQETFGLGVLEAMACGTPVVARAAEGLAELVDDRVGLGVHCAKADEFADAITALFDGERAARSHAARRRAESYDWDCVFPSLFTRYRRLLRREAPGPSASGLPTAMPSPLV